MDRRPGSPYPPRSPLKGKVMWALGSKTTEGKVWAPLAPPQAAPPMPFSLLLELKVHASSTPQVCEKFTRK